MIPGLQHDDKWRMVEDEFVAMAHKLTAHLHAAEYQRLKKLAQDQNADAIRSLSRPVNAPMTNRVKRRQTVSSLQKTQRAGLKRAISRAQDADDGDDDDDDDEAADLPWTGTHLEGLMDSPRKKMVPLTRMVSTASGTRAAALSRKDSGSSPIGTQRSSGAQQENSPIATRKRSVHFQRSDTTEERDLEEHSSSRRPAMVSSPNSQSQTNGQVSSNDARHRPPSTAPGRAVRVKEPIVQKPDPVSVRPSLDDDSDSPVETMFGQHFKDRRSKRRVHSSTPETSKEECHPSEHRPKKGTVRTSLSIPSI